MKKLWIFGDSYSAPMREYGQYANQYFEWKGYEPKVYGDFLSELLDVELVNTAMGGADNYTILNTLCDSIDKIKDDDIIIIGWSSPTRFRLVTDSLSPNGWKSILPNCPEVGFKLISRDSMEQVLINRQSSELYWKEITSWSKLINKTFKNNKVIQFSPFAYKGLSVPFDWIIGEHNIEDIKRETNDLIKDSHYSENGHKHLSKILYDRIIGKLF
jgi:hypothetical protein